MSVLGLVAALLGPHPAYLLHRVLPLEHGAAGSVGHHYTADEESIGLPLGHTAECVESSDLRKCSYIVRLHLPGPHSKVSEPMLWLERTQGGPDVYRVDVVAAVALQGDLAAARILPTEQRDVVALAGDALPDGWYSARAAWRADTRHWRLYRVDAANLRAFDPDHRPTGPLPPRPQLYATLAEGPFENPPDIKRPSIASVSTDWGRKGFRITHLYDVSGNKDVLVAARNASVGVTDVAVVPHDADVRVVYGLVSGGHPRSDLVGLLATTANGSPDVVRYAWRITSHGDLEPVAIDGLACQRRSEGQVGAGLCAGNHDNLVAIRGKP